MAKNMTVLETLRQERGRAVPGGSLKHHSDPLNKKNRAKQQGLYTQRIEGKVAAGGSNTTLILLTKRTELNNKVCTLRE